MVPDGGRADAPLVLVVMPDQWRRAFLRAVLREAGYDAVGARGLASALVVRSPARLIVVDQRALHAPDHGLLARMLEWHRHPATVLIAESGRDPVQGVWGRVVQRPASIADVENAVQSLLPLPPGEAYSVD